MNGLLVYLSGILKSIGSFSNQIFCYRPDYLLAFVGVGMGIVMIALAQMPKKLEDASQIKSKIYNRNISKAQLNHDIVFLRAKNQYWKFITLVEKVGLCYFISATFISIIISYPSPLPTPAPFGYLFIANIAYVMLLVPTIIITCYYFYYRLFQYRLH